MKEAKDNPNAKVDSLINTTNDTHPSNSNPWWKDAPTKKDKHYFDEAIHIMFSQLNDVIDDKTNKT